MRILCLNAWGGKLHAELIAYLAQLDADVLCLQEIVHTPTTDKDWLEYRDGSHILPQRPNLFADIAAILPGHTATFCPAAQGVLWDGDSALPSQFGLATFVRSSLSVIGQFQTFVHKTFSPDGYGDHPRPRNAHAVRLYDPAQSQPVTIAHVHGLRDLAGKMDTTERLAQAQRLASLATTVAEPGDRVILCGDFNVEPDSRTFDILRDIGLHDLVTARGFAGTRNAQYSKPGRFADYMLVNDAVTVKSFDVIMQPEVSDHCPLLLEI